MYYFETRILLILIKNIVVRMMFLLFHAMGFFIHFLLLITAILR